MKFTNQKDEDEREDDEPNRNRRIVSLNRRRMKISANVTNP